MKAPTIVILVGTDHHRFDRVVTWADRRQRAHPDGQVYVQYGQSTPPSAAAGAAFVSPVELKSLVAGADVVITHGGPGTIHDARSAGHRPIVLPRDPGHGEHVDDHQQRFGAWCEERGLVSLARTVEDLDPLLDSLGATGTRVTPTEAESRVSVALVEALVAAPAGPRRRMPLVPGSPLVLNVGAATDAGGRRRLEDAFCGVGGALVLGSVAGVWDALHTGDAACACGAPFRGCAFWVEVGERAYGGWDQLDPAERDWLAAFPSTTNVLAASRRHPGARVRADLLRHASHQRRVLAAAQAATGARVLVDSSPLISLLTQSHDRHLDVRLLSQQPGAGLAGTAAVAAANHRRVPVLALPGAPGTAELTRLVSSLGGPAAAPGQVDHGPDVRLSAV
ncbi:glycosyltransferase [Nocardioides sp.]|uniref:glycosyltransferase n=1 Tax=Nocardioides sp. TaxID=35761 RepID=UPI003D0EF83E